MSNTLEPPRTYPASWHQEAAAMWSQGRQQEAFNLLLADLNRHAQRKPTSRVLQLIYYMFQRGDWTAAAGVLTVQHAAEPDNDQVLLNLAVCLGRSGQYADAVAKARAYLQRHPDESTVWDVLATAQASLGQYAEAAEAGCQSLRLKDQQSRAAHAASQASAPAAPAPNPAAAPSPGGPAPAQADVIAYSLWGEQPRYLWGALDNLLAARQVYPGWQVWVYLDDSVPAPWQAMFRSLGAQLQPQPAGQGIRQKLGWRFQVANDARVRRFLVRDIDSVLNPRERDAVAEWLASGKRFHVMRDWWTHSDLMLAGMWGGTAGVLPPLDALQHAYKTDVLETPNIDQWFLRDSVWPLLHDDCLIHDRCFRVLGSRPWPQPDPQGNWHVGQNEHAVRAAAQARRLQPWLERLGIRVQFKNA